MPRSRRPLLIGLLATVGALTGGVWVVSRRTLSRSEDLQWDSIERPGTVISVRGVGVHYREAGTGSPVLLIHGFGGSTFSFRHLLPVLARTFRVIALDLQGFGYSDRPPDADYSETAAARLVHDFMEAIGIERAALIGHQMGGSIALRVVATWPEKVERLVLVASGADWTRPRRGTARIMRPFLPLVAAFTFQTPRLRKRLLRGAVYDADFLTDEVLQGYFLPFRIRGSMRALSKMMLDRTKDGPIPLAQISQPVLLLWGSDDRWLPLEHARRLQENLPNARLEVIPRSGHLVLEERPDEANRIILDFLLAADTATVSGAGVARPRSEGGPDEAHLPVSDALPGDRPDRQQS